MDRFLPRGRREKLKAEGLAGEGEPYQHNVGHCYRCRTIVEPSESIQWFVGRSPRRSPRSAP